MPTNMKDNSQKTHYISITKCPLCNGEWKFYEGCLGYESFVCKNCGFDVNSINISVI